MGSHPLRMRRNNSHIIRVATACRTRPERSGFVISPNTQATYDDMPITEDTHAKTRSKPELSVRPRHYRVMTRGLITLACGLFVSAGLLALLQPNASALPKPSETSVHLPLPTLPAASFAQSDAIYIEETLVKPGDTLAAILQRLGVEEQGLLGFLTRDPSARAIYKLYPGRSVQAAHDEQGRLAWLRYYHTPADRQAGQVLARWLDVSPAENGFRASEKSQAVSTHTQLAEGVIQHSLFAATDAADIPDGITMQMAEILASRVDFARDLRKGDRFRVVYETYTHQGRAVSSGRVLALEFENGNSVHNAVWFDSPDSSSGYFDFEGRSLRGMFLRSALKFTRVSSTFGMRRHPVHGYWAGHKGVDYAAPNGTPIHATADGVVTFIGQQRGYGNVLYIKHDDRYSTVYAHQSRFAKGLKKGSRVQQGQLIGYVGATGWATGPHLHYELRVNDAPVDPLSVDVPIARTLDGRERQAFKAVLAGYQQHIQMLAALQDDRGTRVAQR